MSSANHSADWLLNNFGFFSRFALITDFYRLNPKFSGVNLECPTKSEWIHNLNNKFSLFCTAFFIFFSSVLCAAGGSSPPLSKSDSRVAAVASSYSTREGRRHQPRIRLPVGVRWGEEAFRGPVLTGSARQRGNSFRNVDSRHYLCLKSMVKCWILHIFRLLHPAASTHTCECHKTKRYIILVGL